MEDRGTGKTITLKIGVWYDADQDNIHIATSDFGGLITTVNENPDSKRGHPNLYMKLSRCLREAGAPHPTIKDDIAPKE